VSFKGLHQLRTPNGSRGAVPPAASRREIGVAVGLAEGPAARQLALTNGCSTLCPVTPTGPAVVVVDDLQWLDRAERTLSASSHGAGRHWYRMLGVVRHR